MRKKILFYLRKNSLPLLCVLGLVLAVGIMSYLDLHPDLKTPPTTESVSFYVPVTVSARQVPDIKGSLLIDQGVFSNITLDTLRFTHQGMKPTLFAQRSVDLLVHFQNLPHNPDEAVATLKTLVGDWQKQGTTVISLMIDYRPLYARAEPPDVARYSRLLKALRKAMNDLSLVVVTDSERMTPETKPLLAPLENTARGYFFMIPSAKEMETTLRLAQGFDKTFNIILPAGVTSAAPYQAALLDQKYFMGFFFTLEADKPWLVHREKIGLFPTFSQ
jgi:hypothetical protein